MSETKKPTPQPPASDRSANRPVEIPQRNRYSETGRTVDHGRPLGIQNVMPPPTKPGKK